MYCPPHRPQHKRTADIFRELDLDKSGTLSADELRTALSQYHVHMNDAEWRKFLAMFDADHDGGQS